MSKVSMAATFTCADGKADEMDAVLRAQVAAAADLDGVEVYSYHRGEGNQYSFFALVSSMEAMQGHGEAESLKDEMPAFMNLLAGKGGGFADPLGLGGQLSLGLASFAEFFCAIAVAIGLLTRLASVPVIILFTVAFFIIHGDDPFGELSHRQLTSTIVRNTGIQGARRWLMLSGRRWKLVHRLHTGHH